jgi:hypothetical protein
MRGVTEPCPEPIQELRSLLYDPSGSVALYTSLVSISDASMSDLTSQEGEVCVINARLM